MSRRVLSAVALSALFIFATTLTAFAEMSRPVIAAFKGQLVISNGELPVGKNDKDTIAKIKKAQLKELKGETSDDVTAWHFSYTAFVTKTGSKTLKLEFLKNGKLAADQKLDGFDAKSAVLSGDISINEDEGLAKGNTYQIQLLTPSGAVVAKTTLVMK